MDTTKIRQELEDLRSQIHFHNYRYNVLDDPLISDVEYDRMMALMQEAVTQQEVSKMISDTFAYKNQVDDEISRRRENAILGTVDVVDAASGREFKVENSSNYYWLDNHGVIVGTETDTKPGWDFQQIVALP